MAHVKKGQLARTILWDRHLRPFWRRQQWRRERAAGKKEINRQINES